MEQSEKISLFKTRDFTQNLETTFAFIKQNYGAICKGIIYFLPLILVSAFVMPNQIELQARISSAYSPFGIFEAYGLDTLLAYICMGLASLAVSAFTICYMSEYVKSKDGVVEQAAVWDKVKQTILPLFISQIVYGICVTIGTFLCIVPGIFIGVACMFYAFTIVNEDKSIIDSLKRSYELVQGNWWMSFGYVLILGIILAILSSIFSIPLMLTSVGQALNIDALSGSVYSVIAATIAYAGNFFLYPVITIAMGVLYYALRNKDEAIDMYSTIDNLGRMDEEKHDNQY